ncbi:MAG: 50S ribosomal protein L13 [Chitinophagia bacterium]|nr:50S ribosomal protein L13 [Chitinophagia bacterium]
MLRHLSFRTQSANETIVKRDWYVVDATNQTLGRMTSRIATVLRGKNKVYYTPHFDCGDYVIVVNAKKVVFTGNKLEDKEYQTYSMYPGGQKIETAKNLLNRRPELVIERAVKGMLPKNRLGRAMFKKLFVYAGPEHPHQAQNPKDMTSAIPVVNNKRS